MYYAPYTYSYPYYAGAPVYSSDSMSRNYQGNNDQAAEAILAGIKGEATAVECYKRLAKLAPDQNHKNEIHRVLHNEKNRLQQFKDLYVSLTGRQPQYNTEKITFNTYQEGLRKAYDIAVKDYGEYRNSSLLTQHSPLQDVFIHACNEEMTNANRFSSLYSHQDGRIDLEDYGGEPFVVNIDEATKQNDTFRTALWTGDHLQVTLMSIDVGDDIGLERHATLDQFLRIEEGQGLVQMGDRRDQLDFEAEASDDFAIMVPAGKWHNLTNTGDQPLKLYSIYAPPEHPYGTVHETKADAIAAEGHDS
ncbi:cupin domain-containing protein [Halobacillus campisalis]|uniref:Cupin domain-containing protein n=1 Tax=Halobacillus campisalis TaxID=435909 RepID=A0ABW2K4K0_9BACI|nr:cupin domain-containing protein [Halobacillus campisalis]